jgi:hypothetical protein
MAGYDVVLGDVASMASTFHTEADTYRGLKDKVSPHPAETGDGNLNNVLQSVMETLDVLHARMTTSIEDHGNKLRDAHDAYARREIDNHGLFDDLTKDDN